ncbi:hypothetical protein [Sporolactobacillus sp. KGMB 08714]|uniref:hypothetical protein n=1 Tax=Sporolactobacillus sp. KGMB 08714 TaxID=3064704 RepID=UPI002FBE7DF7
MELIESSGHVERAHKGGNLSSIRKMLQRPQHMVLQVQVLTQIMNVTKSGTCIR